MARVQTVRVPIEIADERGVVWLVETARERRVLLIENGRVSAVVDAVDRLNESLEKVEFATQQVVSAFADSAAESSSSWSLDETCARLGIDPARVRERARPR